MCWFNDFVVIETPSTLDQSKESGNSSAPMYVCGNGDLM
jgi:hypothetical protein